MIEEYLQTTYAIFVKQVRVCPNLQVFTGVTLRGLADECTDLRVDKFVGSIFCHDWVTPELKL
jgi:hypothetical protein